MSKVTTPIRGNLFYWKWEPPILEIRLLGRLRIRFDRVNPVRRYNEDQWRGVVYQDGQFVGHTDEAARDE